MLWISNSLIDDGVDIQTLIVTIQSLESQPQTSGVISTLNGDYAQMGIYNDNYLFDYNCLFYLSMLTLAFIIKEIQELIYTKLRGVFLQFFTIETILDIFNTFIAIFWVYKHYSSLGVGLDSVRPELRAWQLIYRMQIDDTFNINIIIATTMDIQLTRLVFSLQVTKTFGPMIKILGSMLVSVAIFMLLFTVLFLIFAVIGLQLFLDLDAFITSTITCIVLFSACLGNFDYTIFDSATIVSPYIGYIYMTLFLMFIMIMLLNFLIAILSSIYARLNDVQIALYLRKVLYLRQKYDYDERYSCMISAVPPLILLAFILPPLIILQKSKILNYFILLLEYIPVMLTAIIIFVICSLLMLPIAYGLLLFYKCSNLFNKPIFGTKDMLLRIADLVIFVFLGIFIISFWVCLDIVNFTLRLFDLKIIYINTLEQEYFEGINKKMDGIEKAKVTAANEIQNAGSHKIHDEEKAEEDVQSKVKTLQKALNPIKEGLSDNTLKIFKACLKVVKDRHFKALGKMDKDEFKYIPTFCVLFEMKEMFMITEQINTVLFGVTYIKKQGFIESDKFQEIVDCILEFEKKELRINAEDEESEDEDENIIDEDQEISESETGVVKGNKRREEIERDVRCFLTKSNEKWILDQYNLCKRFLIQNSIQGNYDEFSHPVYQKFEHVRNLKNKCRNLEAIGNNYKKFSEIIRVAQLGLAETTTTCKSI